MKQSSLFDQWVYENGIGPDKFIPMNTKKNIKVGDAVISAIGNHGVVVELGLCNDIHGNLEDAVWIFWHNNKYSYDKRVTCVPIHYAVSMRICP
ncbi:MAG: hypothetical protein ABFD07_18050 [Methanobacterium sp.]